MIGGILFLSCLSVSICLSVCLVDGGIHFKNRENSIMLKPMMHKFPLRLWCKWIPPSTQKIFHRFLIIFHTFKHYLLLDVIVVNGIAIDVAKCALPRKVMQWSPYWLNQ